MTQANNSNSTDAPTELTVHYHPTKEDLISVTMHIRNRSSTVRKQTKQLIIYVVVVSLAAR